MCVRREIAFGTTWPSLRNGVRTHHKDVAESVLLSQVILETLFEGSFQTQSCLLS